MKKKKIYQDKIEKSEIRVRRLVALIIDWYLTSVITAIPITFSLRKSDALTSSMFDFSSYGYETSLFLVFYSVIVFIIYYIVIPLFIWKGQTLGKKICKIKVVQDNLEDVKLTNLLMRELIGQTIVEGGIVVSSSSLRQLLLIYGYTSFLKYFQYIAYALTVISIVYACFQPYMQCFHDKLGKTIVIKQK